MSFFDRLDQHFDLFSGMAAHHGADPADLAGQPNGASRLRAAVLRCTGCSRSGACAAWQARHLPQDPAPEWCRNADLLRGLAPA
ncbi:adenylosuccinate lyase [Mesobaculum littorinae]|uniref:Adenylosuccinate lyase n=1 Tax=Mesobaculum littorinae TaxID=2486419 RepID=A0A438AKN5_9RHOB|nr:DUF6455 family protein [Mesobaculum littorinae]RVV99166.1 adenylosuccinate lyase [Mesobaculum littorinae]